MTPAPQSFQWEPPQAPRPSSSRIGPTRKELDERKARRDIVARYFRSRPDEWIGRETLIANGSGSAPQTRVSECKLQLGMVIDSRQTRYVDADGISHRGFQEYRYVPNARLPIKG